MDARFVTPLLLTLGSVSALAQSAPVAANAAAGPMPTSTAPTPTSAQSATGRAHICLAPASVEVASGSSTAAMDAIRLTFTSFLTGPTLEVAPLSSRLESQARAEAKADNCPYLLLTSVKQVHKSGGGGSGLFQRMAGSAVQQGAYAAAGSVNSTAGQVAVTATGGAAGTAAATYGSSTKSQDELTLTSRLESADGKVLVNMTDKRKASSDGEDLLTPLVEKASTAVASAVAKPTNG